MLRILGIDANLCSINNLASRAENEAPAVLIGEKRSGFGHSVADGERETYLPEPLLDVRIKGCAAHDYHTDLTAEGI